MKIGEEVYCIRGHEDNLLKAGTTYNVIDFSPCPCGGAIHIGFTDKRRIGTLCDCGHIFPGTERWYCVNRFVKLSEISIEQFEELFQTV